MVEQEAYGIYYAVRKWNYYLQGANVIVGKHHKPLAPFLNGNNANTKINRWGFELGSYNITFEWISSTRNKAADSLSRFVLTQEPHKFTVNMILGMMDGPATRTRSKSKHTVTSQEDSIIQNSAHTSKQVTNCKDLMRLKTQLQPQKILQPRSHKIS